MDQNSSKVCNYFETLYNHHENLVKVWANDSFLNFMTIVNENFFMIFLKTKSRKIDVFSKISKH